MRFFRTFMLVILVFGLMTASVFGAEIGINVNEKDLKTTLPLEKGISRIPLKTTVEILGAELTWVDDVTFTIKENDQMLKMTVGETTAYFNEQKIELQIAPYRKDNITMVPLRFIQEIFGGKVKWDQATKTAKVQYQELRDNLPVEEMLAKSTEESKKYNSYRMTGKMNNNIEMLIDGKDPSEDVPGNMNSIINIEGYYQQTPVEIYMKQDIEMLDIPEEQKENMPDNMTVESYITEEAMYMNLPEQGWVEFPMMMDPEVFKQQMNNNSDPAQVAKLMEDFGIILNFGNDINIDGIDYYVINGSMDMEKFRQGQEKLMKDILPSINKMETDNTEEAEKMQEDMMKVIRNMEMDYKYSIFINKETFLTDRIDLNGNVKIKMDDTIDGETKNISMKMKIKGTTWIKDYGTEFIAPDVSSAKKMSEINLIEN